MNINTEQKVRLFIALDLPTVNDQNEPIQFASLQLLIGESIIGFRPVKSFHSTLVFIGSVYEKLIPIIKIAIERAVQLYINEQKKGLVNGIGGLMIKPGATVMGKNAVALQLVDNYQLNALANVLLKTLQESHIQHDERKGTPNLHVTIGRIPIEKKKQIEVTRFLAQLPAPVGSSEQLNQTFTVHAITFYQSLPNSEYISLARYLI